MLRDIFYFVALAWVIVGCVAAMFAMPDRFLLILALLVAAVAGGWMRARRIMGDDVSREVDVG